MKKYVYSILTMFVALVMATGCDKEEIVFDSEKPAFETRAGLELVQALMPDGTNADDEIYIVGAFNGGFEAAVGNPEYQLEQSPTTSYKWGVYLDPAKFVDGKTLADGFYIYNKQQGEERTALGDSIMHYENCAPGNWINVTVQKWAKYFEKPVNPDEVEHDGYAIFVIDNTGWDALALYAWGDAEIFGGWPGIQATGTINIGGVQYQYFDTG